ncbi:pyridine nucleotide-disulfide oxidoreductase [Hirsutella rhossiliensis]|uniref:Pyridine nucleotide-disulfide oxidoreductase domain-containing protein n=1 Tax=Hirsutella rhossiliensis TaxID=111463 RepID=A0A9P8N166_9HYPO|nr:pyridine nucleotide-disulfide oxidoreductase domain-containing protein [Hirsutella rhossiliensis]KAH0965773.1 pyridine nucleotide-disulfide oxidoreductase domain-containing protein [Hirsutella rhossiliensis]
MAKTVVILGGSLGGLAVAHRLLKHTRPREDDLRVILVSKNSHFYWNLASVRAVIPGLVKDADLLQPIEPGLSQYPSGSVEFVLGAATGVDSASKTVRISVAAAEAAGGGDGDGSQADQKRTVAYDYLVVATGADAADAHMPWKAAGSYEDCLASLHGTAARIRAAEHVVVAGGGPTGVEVAAEIKDAFPAKTVVLLNAGAQLVGGDPSAGAVERELRRIGVDVRNNAKGAVDDAGPGGGKTKVSLSDGSEMLTDLYLPTTGLTPNSGFLPKDLLTDRGYVHVDDYMRVRAAPDMWAVGDVVSKPRAGFLITDAQAAGVAKNIDLVLQGRGRGAGRLGPIPIPSFFVWAVKGRTLGMERTSKYADGTMF